MGEVIEARRWVHTGRNGGRSFASGRALTLTGWPAALTLTVVPRPLTLTVWPDALTLTALPLPLTLTGRVNVRLPYLLTLTVWPVNLTGLEINLTQN